MVSGGQEGADLHVLDTQKENDASGTSRCARASYSTNYFSKYACIPSGDNQNRTLQVLRHPPPRSSVDFGGRHLHEYSKLTDDRPFVE